MDTNRDDGSGAVGREAGRRGGVPMRATIAASVLQQGSGVEEVEAVGEVLCEVVATRVEVRAHSGKLLCVTLNCAVGIERTLELQDPVWVCVEGKDFVRKYRVC